MVHCYRCVIVNWMVHSYICVIIFCMMHILKCVIMNWVILSYSFVIMYCIEIIPLCFQLKTYKTFKTSFNERYLFLLDGGLAFNYPHQ